MIVYCSRLCAVGWGRDPSAALRHLFGLMCLQLHRHFAGAWCVGTRGCGAGCQIVGGEPLPQFSPDLPLPQIERMFGHHSFRKGVIIIRVIYTLSSLHHHHLAWTGGRGSDGSWIEEELRSDGSSIHGSHDGGGYCHTRCLCCSLCLVVHAFVFSPCTDGICYYSGHTSRYPTGFIR